jgi:hypothetical protein
MSINVIQKPVDLTTTQTITGSKTFNDTGFTLQDNSDNTKKAVFELSGITTGTTRTYTLPNTSAEIAIYTAPTIQRFTSGSGTYTTPSNVKYIIVEMVAGGGGGGGSGTTDGTAATAGGNTTFGSSLLTAVGGSAGARNAVSPTGGSPTINAPASTLISLAGSRGQGSMIQGSGTSSATPTLMGGNGGSSFFGVFGAGGAGSNPGIDAPANSGAGGGGAGASTPNSLATGTGGCAGAYIRALIVSPSASYSYAVGAGGSGQAAGTSGQAGGAGGSGVIVVTEYYN